jgi:hypothetical protein
MIVMMGKWKKGASPRIAFDAGTAWTGFITTAESVNWRLRVYCLRELLDSLQLCVCNIGISMSLISILGAFLFSLSMILFSLTSFIGWMARRRHYVGCW